ncbi:endonuclease/exonuclease/phosphatase family protein [Vibrio breoganii]|uniref:Endonuclease/exonuclease/phosphatase domain-containing protein n=1 Tax=Vibrio breoganii TaxID=553239 RepID=A0AAP8MZ81_9VIBR|nr:endonuclease/exonuclease/phosphatase family protein [Vibrio breoganii]PMP13498.1 hypothetical protein BCS93_04875 [Vibrio breoganii]
MDGCSLRPHQIKITTFNLFNYLAPPGAYYDFENIYSFAHWQDKQHWTLQQIEASDADVIGFQEIFSAVELGEQLASIGYPYFAVIDEPKVESDFIHSEPVVGIASRYPLLSVSAIESDPTASAELGFAFSRAPLHALIELPVIGKVDCVVVHFKSQRPKALSVENPGLKPIESWRSTMQRGLEARFIDAFFAQRKRSKGYPQVLMGDFNRDLSSAEFSCFHTTRDDETTGLGDSKTLLAQEPPIQATHYYGAKGSVLDYIMLSEEFDRNSASCLFEVSHYQVSDSHLVNPIYAIDRMASDHGIVTITLTERD